MTGKTMEALTQSTVLFALVLALSFVVERLLEVLKTVIDLLDSRYDWHRYWTRQAHGLRERLVNELRILELAAPQLVAGALARFGTVLGQSAGNGAATVVIAGDLVRCMGIKVGARLVAIATGVLLASVFRVDLMALVVELADVNAVTAQELPAWLRTVVTGLIIGLGTGPVHKFIVALEKRRAKAQEG
jgi:hypothetical protein